VAQHELHQEPAPLLLVSAPVERFTAGEPVLAPPTDGARVTLIVQFVPAAREAGQVVASGKSPVKVMLCTATADVLLFVTVTV
jgi:hypothetical protein